jgi:hypothetical protein
MPTPKEQLEDKKEVGLEESNLSAVTDKFLKSSVDVRRSHVRHERGKKKRRRSWMIYQKLKPNMMSPLTKMMLKKNPLNPVQLCLQELKDHRPKRFWHVIHIITQV